MRQITRKSLRQNYGRSPGHLAEEGEHSGEHRLRQTRRTLEEVIEAAKAAHAHSFIRRLPRAMTRSSGRTGAPSPKGRSSFSASPG